jgi:hypothetical protein
MDETIGRKPRGSRRRLTLWALFGTVGLIMGAAYATGFAASGGSSTDTVNAGEATQVFGKPAAENPSQYAAMVSAGGLALTFDGNYATIAAPSVLFELDLSHADPYGVNLAGTYYADVLLTNFTALGMTGTPAWDFMDLRFIAIDCTGNVPVLAAAPAATTIDWTAANAGAGSAPTGDGAGVAGLSVAGPPVTHAVGLPAGTATAQMYVDRADAHVTFTNLKPAHTYCIGLDQEDANSEALTLQASTGGVVDGTVLFRPNAEAGGVVKPAVPQFAVTLSRSA